MQPFRYFLDEYFPNRIVWGIAAFIGSIELFVYGYPLVGIAIVCLGILSLTTHYGLEINSKDNYYKFYIWILGKRVGKKMKFDRIEYLHISKINTSDQNKKYEGSIKFSKTTEMQLLRKERKREVVDKLKRIGDDLNLIVKDETAN